MTNPRPYTDLMIDIETLGLTPGSVMPQIGLCSFNRDDPDEEAFELTLINLDMTWQIEQHDFTVSGDTIKWWLSQSEDARKAIYLAENCVGLNTAFGEVQRHLRVHHDCGGASEMGALRRVWAKPAAFDLAHVEAAYRHVRGADSEMMWSHRASRDLYTLLDCNPADIERPTPRVAHRADHDALAQAIHVKRAWTGISAMIRQAQSG